MIELALWLLPCHEPMDQFFPGYLPLPNPTKDDQEIIPIPAQDGDDLAYKHDPIKTA